MSGLLGPVTANPLMMAQALKAREQPRKQLAGQGLLDVAATGLSPVPVIGDALGLAADASRFYNEPESRTPLNFGLAALGAIPFIPPLVSMGLGKFAQSQGKTLSAPSMSGPAKNQAGAIVYHGSPHKFDQFDSSKIGTGEGAQAYGHGLYFAENPAVAKEYQKALSNNLDGRKLDDVRYVWGKSGVEIDAYPSNNNQISLSRLVVDKSQRNQGLGTEAMKDLIQYADDVGKTIKLTPSTDFGASSVNRLKEFYKRFGFVENKGANKDWRISDTMYRPPESRGSLYKVDLPDEAIAKMLDWDKPLSQQAPEVQKAISRTGLLGDPSSILSQRERVFAEFDAGKITREQRNSALEKIGSAVNSEKQGSALYTALGSQAEASKKLRELGVPGIKYLDGFSRGPQGGSGTSNYVVFPGNEGLLKILERQ